MTQQDQPDRRGSLLGLMGLDLPVPDHTPLSRRARTLAGSPSGERTGAPAGRQHRREAERAGEWLVEKHGTRRRRAWRKLHLGVDAKTGTIVASTLTSKEVDDAAELGPLLIRSRNRSLRLLPMAPTTRTMFTTPSPNILLRLWLSYRRVQRRFSAPRPKPTRPSATAIFRSLPSRVEWLGKKPRATMREPGPRAR